MSTIYCFDEELSTGGTILQPTDKMLVHEASSSIKKVLTGDLVARGAPGIVNTLLTVLPLTAAAHAQKMVCVSSTASTAVTLPQATGTGNKYRLQFQVAATGTASTIKVANSTDVMQGIVLAPASTTVGLGFWATSATSDTLTLNGGTTGGKIGDWYEFTDILTGFWMVNGMTQPTVTNMATPFSATV